MLFLFLVGLGVATYVLKKHRELRARLIRNARFLSEYVFVVTGARAASPGFVQRAVYEAVLGQCTIAVNGAVRMPTSIEVLISPEAAELAATLGRHFTADVVDAVHAEADQRGWELDTLDVRLVVDETRNTLRPIARIGGSRTPKGQPSHPSRQQPPNPTPAMTQPAPSSAPSRIATSPHPGLELTFETDPDRSPIRAGSADHEIVLGRTSGDVLIGDPTVSNQHCRLVRTSGRWMVEDLGSRNGTFHNGDRVTEPRELADGDAIGLGRGVLLRVR